MATNTHPQPITATPAKDQLITHEDKTYSTVKEGKAYILVPPKARTSVNPNAKAKADEEQKVFYNPIQQFNRDLSVLAIKAYGEDLCQRKRARREVVKGKEEKKRARKKGQKAGGVRNAAVEEEEGEVGAKAVEEEGEVEDHDAGVSNKRKRAVDEDDDEDAEQAAKAPRIKIDSTEWAEEQRDATQVTNDATRAKPETTTAAAGKRKRIDVDAGEDLEEDRPTKVRKGSDETGGTVDGESPEQPTASSDAAAPTEDGAANVDDPSVAANAIKESFRAANNINGETHATSHAKPWQPSFRILDALSATGLRALRYATEIPSATHIVANDRDRGATASIALNVEHNDLSTKIHPTTGDAIGHMYAAAYPSPSAHGPSHISGKYDVIDLDPYGTAVPFLDAALQAIHDEGMLCVTCTDSGVWASCGYSEKTFSLYGGMPIKGLHGHEGGLRLILRAIATSAAKYSLAIEPLLSLSIDFYARVFVRVRKSAADVKFLAGKTMLVYECDVGCGAWKTQFLGRHQRHGKGESGWKFIIGQGPTTDKACEFCGSKMHIAGPMWGGPLHNGAFVEKILDDIETADKETYQTLPRIEGMLDTALNELRVNREVVDFSKTNPDASAPSKIIPQTSAHLIDHHPFYFTPSALCKVIKAVAPAENLIKGALRHAGYVVTRSHAKAGSLKTDAPWNVLWEIMREWVRQKSPVRLDKLREGGPGRRILEKTRITPIEETLLVNGERVDGANGNEAAGAEAATVNGGGDGGAANGNGAAAADADTPDITVNGTAPQGPAAHQRDTSAQEADVSKLKVVFDEKLGRDKEGKKRLVRYQQNPRENWGPMARARGTG